MDDRNLDEIILRGFRGAQSARQAGQDYQFFNRKTIRAVQEEEKLRADARYALENQEFQLYLQFYVDAGTGRAAGGEILPLWEHPEQGFLPAERFLPLLEREGLSPQLDEYVLERACAMLDSLRQRGREDFFLLCRLAESTLCGENLREQWERIAEAHQFNRRLLFLSVPQCVMERTGSGIKAVRELDASIVLDGFDGQLTALPQAKDARFRGIKLDRSLTGREQSEAVLRAAVQAGHELELTILAEGADTVEQAARMRELGCDMLRGELYAPPLPVWEAMKKLMGGQEVTASFPPPKAV